MIIPVQILKSGPKVKENFAEQIPSFKLYVMETELTFLIYIHSQQIKSLSKILIIHTSLLYIVPGICYANLDKKYTVWHFFRKTTFQRHGWAHRKKKRCCLSSIYDLKVVNMRSAHQMCTNLTHHLILPPSQTWWTICKLQIKQKKYVHTAMCLLLLSTWIHTTMCLLHLCNWIPSHTQ